MFSLIPSICISSRAPKTRKLGKIGPSLLLSICYMCVLSRFSHFQLFGDPMVCSPPSSSVHGILQARILKWAAVPSSRESSQPRDQSCLLCLLHWLAGSLPLCVYAAAKSLQSCPTLCNPIDGSPLGSSVPRILQARTLEWVAISFSNA